MSQIYTLNGQQVYNNNGQVYSVQTGQVVSGASQNQPNPTPSPTPPPATPNVNPFTNTTYDPNGPISSNNFTTSPSPTYQNQTSQPSFDFNYFNNIANSLSPEETDIQRRLKDLVAKNEAVAGKVSYQQGLEESAGLTNLQQAQDDLIAQIKGYQLEAQGLQNASQYTIPNQIQQNFEGRGAVASAIAPIQAGALRANQIQQGILASKALTASAGLLAAQGKLASAQTAIERAVKLKFGQDEEDIRVAKENLQLLMQDPALDLATKKRAEAQYQLKEYQQQQIADKKAEQSAIWNLMTNASTNIANFVPTQEYPTFAVARQAMQTAPSKEKALEIATSTGLLQKQDTSPQVIGTSETGYYRYNPTTTQYERIKNIPIQGKKVEIDQLTLNERQKQYPDLPLELVGRSEIEVIQQLQSSTPPQWFSKVLPGPLPPKVIRDNWEKFRKKVIQYQRNGGQDGA